MAKIKIMVNDKKLEVPWGKNLREVLLDNHLSPYEGVFKSMNCHGLGICGSCLIRVKKNEIWEETRSCQIQCFSDLEIQLK